jgi:hypothetical protein
VDGLGACGLVGEFGAARRPDGSVMKPPVFVLGTQRSGTTLLCQILNSHPGVYVLNELGELYPHLEGDSADLRSLEDVLRAKLKLHDVHLGGQGSSDLLSKVGAACERKAADLGKHRWGLKDPHLTYHAERFRSAFPDSRFVIALRDPRGVVASYLEQRWNVANAASGALLWKKEVEMQTEFMRRHPAECLLVKYEDLLREPKPVLRRVCDFLGEIYTDDLLDYHRSPPAGYVHAGNVNITRPLQKDVADKWQTALSSRQVGIVEAFCAEAMTAFGYNSVGRPIRLTGVEMTLYSIHQQMMTTYWWQRRSHWRGLRQRIRRTLGKR